MRFVSAENLSPNPSPISIGTAVQRTEYTEIEGRNPTLTSRSGIDFSNLLNVTKKSDVSGLALDYKHLNSTKQYEVPQVDHCRWPTVTYRSI